MNRPPTLRLPGSSLLSPGNDHHCHCEERSDAAIRILAAKGGALLCSAGRTDPSTPLRSAQDDTVLSFQQYIYGIQDGPDFFPLLHQKLVDPGPLGFCSDRKMMIFIICGKIIV